MQLLKIVLVLATTIFVHAVVHVVAVRCLMAAPMTPRRLRAKDLRGIRQRGKSYQVRVFGGIDPLTGKDVYLTGSAQTERDAIRLRDRLRSEVAENRSTRTSGTLGHLLREWLDQHPGEKETVDDYRFLAESFIIPALGGVKLTRLTQPGPSLIEKFYAELRRCRRRCDGRPFVEHRKGCPSDSDPGHQCDGRCKQHVCKPLGGSTLRHIHVVLNGAFKAAVRWGWIGVNPLDMIPKPRAPKPQPNPPSAANAARIIDKAWATDAEWGTFVWLTMVTGARRGELVALAHPEPGVYPVGMKSYGRAPTFLAMTGYEQVRSVAAAIAGDTAAAERVELTLPETGVCGGSGEFDTDGSSTGGCCAPAAPELITIGRPGQS